MIRIFISHSIKDKEIADAFVDIILHGAMSVELDEIFCISTEGTKIKSGEDWRDAIKEALSSAEVTFLIITPNYKESEMCLNEMGAAWVLSSLVLPTIVEPITFKTVGVIPEVTQVKKLLDEIHLDDLRDSVQNALEIPAAKIASGRWTQKKKEFIKRVRMNIENDPFPRAMDRKSYDEALRREDDLNKTVDNLIEEMGELENQIKDLEKAKDANQVKAIKKKYNPCSEFDEFKGLSKSISNSLKFFKPIIRGIIFRTFNNKDTKFDWQSYKKEIEEADSEDYIEIDDDNGTIEADWFTTQPMEEIHARLHNLNLLIEKGQSEEFLDLYFENYKAPLKIDNKSFWEEVFETVIYIN